MKFFRKRLTSLRSPFVPGWPDSLGGYDVFSPLHGVVGDAIPIMSVYELVSGYPPRSGHSR